jgi:hypothetical protein
MNCVRKALRWLLLSIGLPKITCLNELYNSIFDRLSDCSNVVMLTVYLTVYDSLSATYDVLSW